MNNLNRKIVVPKNKIVLDVEQCKHLTEDCKALKIAVCYSGMFRNFVQTAKNHKAMIYNFYNCDIYASLWDVYGEGRVSTRYDFIQTDKITSDDKEKIHEILSFKNIEFVEYEWFEKTFIQNNKHKEHLNNSTTLPHPKNVLSMFYKIKRAGEMVDVINTKYDLIIRMRTDILFDEPLLLAQPFASDHLYTPLNCAWNMENWVGDTFFYGDVDTMRKVHSLFDTLQNSWNRNHTCFSPEFILANYLQTNNIQPVKLKKPIVLISHDLKKSHLQTLTDFN